MTKPMDVTPEISEALARLRAHAHPIGRMDDETRECFNVLDNAGVFAEIDEHNDYAAAEGILAESAAISMVGQSNPNIPAHKALQVLHDTWHPERAETVGQYARRISGGEHHEQLPDNFLDLVDELSRPIVSDDGTVIPPAM